MHGNFLWPRSAQSAFVALCVDAACASASNLAMAGCGMYTGPQSAPPSWSPQSTTATDNDFEVKDSGGRDKDGRASDGSNAGIVGMWRLSFYSDGTAYPTQIPKGVMVDFGISQWHPDKTEFLISGGRAPSTSDVCMGVWKQSGRSSYELKHIGLSYVSGDTPPPLGPVVPAVFVGPAIIKQFVTLSRSLNRYEGDFTIDQYGVDEKMLLQHIAGRVVATRFTAD